MSCHHQGLLGLNKLMLVYGKEEIAQVLRICANSSNYPIMYHCSSGKDRTGTLFTAHAHAPDHTLVAGAPSHSPSVAAATAWVVAGLITALILMCCGVDAQDIITNYHQSEIFLSPVMDRITAENQAKGLNAGFDGTPPEVMEQTIGYIFEKWGSITGTTQHAHARTHTPHTHAQAAQHADELTLLPTTTRVFFVYWLWKS